MAFDPVDVCLGDSPLAGDAFVNQGLAVGSEGRDLDFDATKETPLFQIMVLDLGNNLALHTDLWKRNANEPKVTVAEPLSRRTSEGRKDLILSLIHI